MIACEVCGSDPAKDPNVVLTRQNAFGVSGVWRCGTHNQVPTDPEVDELVKIIHGADHGKLL